MGIVNFLMVISRKRIAFAMDTPQMLILCKLKIVEINEVFAFEMKKKSGNREKNARIVREMWISADLQVSLSPRLFLSHFGVSAFPEISSPTRTNLRPIWT